MFPILCAMAAMAWQANVTTEGGLARVEFTSSAGRITVFLPDDLRVGDVISGTVIPEPGKGGQLAEVELGGKPVTPGMFRTTLSGPVRVSVGGATVELPLDRTTSSAQKFWTAPVMQKGRPVQISGPFDGNAANTSVSFSGERAAVIAESPRSTIVLSSAQNTGIVKIALDEAGRDASLTTACTDLKLTTGVRTMLKGQRTTLKVEVTGLASVPEVEYPLSLELTNHSSAVVRLEGAGGHRQAFAVQFADVKAGMWSKSFDVVALADGPYLISGILFGVKIHDLKMALDAEQLGALIDATIAATQAKKDKKVAEDAPDWAINLYKTKLRALNDAKDALPDLDNARVSFDKALADFTLFQMAAELIDFAAEMLGYKDLPLPGIGHALKVLKIASKKVPKAIELLEKAEKLVEKLGELEDGKEKLEKIEEAKKLLEKVKEEIGKE